METDVLILLGWVFLFMVFVVGGYLLMFLNIMRVDPREKEFRKIQGHDNTLVPHKYKSEKEKIEKKKSEKEKLDKKEAE